MEGYMIIIKVPVKRFKCHYYVYDVFRVNNSTFKYTRIKSTKVENENIHSIEHAFLDVPLRNDWQRLLIASRGRATYPQRIHLTSSILHALYGNCSNFPIVEKFGRKRKSQGHRSTIMAGSRHDREEQESTFGRPRARYANARQSTEIFNLTSR